MFNGEIMSLNNVLPVNEINSINVLGKKVLGKKNKFFSVLPDALEVNNLRSNKPCSEVLRSMNASNFFASAPSLQRAKQLETQARQQNHKRKLYYASLEYVRYADENLNVTKPSFPCAKSELDSYLVILDQKLSYYKQAFLCAYDSNKDSFALKIAKKIQIKSICIF